MRLTKKTSKRVLALLISALMIISMLPVSVLTVFALSATALKTDIAEKTLYTEQATEFTFTTKASSEDVGKMVLGTFKLLDENGLDAQSAVKSLKYWDEANGCYSDFYGDFGPAETGFPLQNGATSKFCVTFNKAGNYKVKASIINFTDRSVLVAEDTEVTVKPYASALTTDIDTKTFVNNTEVEFTYTTVANAQRDTMVLGTFSVLDSESKDAKSCIKSLKYWDVTNNCYREFCGDFGPSATGFPLADATSKFRVTFNKAGTYTVNVAIKKFDDGEILCSNTKTITVQDNNSNLTTDITEKTFEVNEKVEFTYTTYAGDFADTMVLGKFTLKKNGKEVDKNSLKLEYWDVTNACYREFYGSFGPAATGFPLTDATSKFRVSFKETGKYDILVQMVKFADDTVVCENAATVEVKDTKAPVISEITGNATEWTGSDVTLKVVAADNSGSVAQYRLDGGEWQTSNTFNIKENGKYKFYAKDAAGNISDASAEIEVKYIDKVAPVIGVITLNPDDWTNKAVTVTVPATDVGINVILYRMDNGDWQKENTFTVSDNDIHEFYVKDSLGNENSAPAKIKADKYDAEAPVIKSITPNTTEWVSDKVTVTVDATDEGVMGIAYKLGKDGEWQSINTFDITENGTYQVYVKDALGNEIANPEEIVIGNIDKTAPEIVDFTSTTEDWTNKDVTISGTVKEAESGIAKLQYQIDKGEWTDLAFDKDGKFSITVSDECSVTYTFKCTDKVGNVSEGTYSKTVKIDKTPASVSVNEISDTWKNEQITVVGKVEDTASGIKSAVYDNGEGHEGDKGELDIHGSDFKFKTNVTKSGEYTYKITVIDEAGNETVIDNVTVKIDLENPVTSVKEADAWTNQKVDVVVTASDDAAGINKVYYKKNGGSEVEIGFIDGSYKFTIPNDADDNAEYEIYSVDNSGRKSNSVFYKAMIDVTKPQKPTITYTKALKYKLIDMVTFGLYNTPVNVTISSSDALSGLKEIKYYFDDAEHSAKPNEEGKITFAIEPENQYKVSAVAYDNAGNDSEKENVGTDGTKSDIGGVIVTLDTTAPKVVSASADITEWTNGEVKISGEVSDDLSGVEHVYYTKDESNTPVEITDFDGKNYNFTINPQSYSGKYYIYCVDHSTNVSEKKDVDVKMDNTSPNVDTLNVSTTNWANSVTVTGKVSDDLSGVSKVYWRQGADGEENEATLKEDGTYGFVVSKLNYEGLILVGCYDNAGNKAEEKNFEIQIDSAIPTVDGLNASTTKWINSLTVTAEVSDNLSGVSKVYWKQGADGEENKATLNEDGTYEFTVSDLNYVGLIFVGCYDNAGNKSEEKNFAIQIDKTEPTVESVVAEPDEWTNGEVKISGEVSDNLSGVKTVHYRQGQGETKTATLTENTYEFTVTAQDYNGNFYVWCEDWAGNISKEKSVVVKMDITKPDNLTISYNKEIKVWQAILSGITFGYYSYNPSVVVTMTADDVASGIDYFAWKYTREDNVSKENVETKEGEISANSTEEGITFTYSNGGKTATASFKLTADQYNQYRGSICFTATDRAGNTSELNDDKRIHVIDTIAPNIDITYAADKENTGVRFVGKNNEGVDVDVDNFEDAYQAFYNGKVNATIKVTENNFFEGDTEFDNDKKENGVVHEVGILVTKTDNDGTVTKTEYLPNETKEFTWTTDGNVHTCIIPYEEDADYEVTVKYVDFSGNEAEISANDGNVGNEEGSYTSKIVTVDTTAPVITVKYDPDNANANNKYFNTKRTATVTVEEHNFIAENVMAAVTAKDVTTNSIENEKQVTDYFKKYFSDSDNWYYMTADGTLTKDVTFAENPDIHVATVEFDTDAHYTFVLDCKDIIGNEAKQYEAPEFVIDQTEPSNLTISYKEEIKVWQAILSEITFGYYSYKPSVVVTMTADDVASGIDYFEWEYTREDNVSTKNVETKNGKISANSTEEGVTFTYSNSGKTATASFKLTADQYNQYRGSICFTATDRAGNTSEPLNDDKRINIVDNIAPTRVVEYTPAQRVVDAVYLKDKDVYDKDGKVIPYNKDDNVIAYYNDKNIVTVTIDEANFYKEDVKVAVTKDGVNFPVEVYWEDNPNDEHVGTFTLSNEGDYIVNISYTDRSGNEMDSYTSPLIVIDKTKPVITVDYTDEKKFVYEIDGREYYTTNRTATIKIEEHNFRADDVVVTVYTKDIIGNNIQVGELRLNEDGKVEDGKVNEYLEKGRDRGNWSKYDDVDSLHRNDDTFELVLDYTEEANYTFDIEYADLAKNYADDYAADEFTIDRTKPECVEVKYSETVDGKNVIEKILNTITFGAIYYNEQMEVTITAKDDISGINHFVYSYEANDDVSKVNAELLNQTIAEALENSPIVFDKRSGNFTAKFNIPKKALTDLNQFNGTVHFTAYDRSGNESDRFSGESTIVVDNIKPTSTVTFNEPVQKVGDVSYYAGAINASIVINEANFFSEDVKVVVTKDGVNFPVKVDWKDNNVDVHTGTFTLEAPENHSLDGVYIVNVSYVDRSTNEMTPFVSNPLTIDTKVPVIAVSNVKHQSANNGETISFTVSATDTNMSLAGFKPNLKAVIKKDNGNNSFAFETIAIALGNAATTKNANGETVYTYSVNNLEVDGFYSLVCSAVDYANHSVSVINSATDAGGSANVETMNFSVNREGSVFWIETEHNDKYTGETFTDKLNGAYANDEVTVKLHEINVDKVDVNADKKTVFTLNDGSSSEDIELKEGENYSKNVVVGAGGWYETVYTLENSNFDHDGVYSLNVITYDKANNSNVNTKTEAGTISFTLDRTNPVISANIKDDQSVKDTQFWVEFEITETNLNAETVAVKLTDNEGKTVETEVEDLGNNKYRFLVDSGYNYTIEITAKDLAGNESELYKVEHFTVSTNILVLWYANTPLFWGSIGGTLLLAGAVILLVFLKKRKKNEDK